jgi:hypothetical protein
MSDEERIKVDVVEITFYRDRTKIDCYNGQVYILEPTMVDGSPMVLEFFHNEIFPTSTDRILGVEGDKAMRN